MIEILDTLPLFVRMIASLIIVVALMGGLALLLKKLDVNNLLLQTPTSDGAQERLQIIKRLQIDPRRQAVLLRHDAQEHLIILGANETTHISTTPIQDDPA